jgi:hypothetical protein
VRTEIDRGITGVPPGTPPPDHTIGRLFFRTMDDLENAIKTTVADFIADERKYTDVPSLVQISQVME